MSQLNAVNGLPQDIVAIFHASFHPTQGNVLDWSLKASPDLDLSHLEFNCLPSGLHLVQSDVVYFSKGAHRGVCVFRRRKTAEDGHRGFRLSSLGILLAPSSRPRPWRHVASLKTLVSDIYDVLEDRGVLQPTEADWEPARAWFEARQVRRSDLNGAGDWNGWSSELENADHQTTSTMPMTHLPHLLRILGPAVYTLYKHVLGRRRILIFTLPPVEAACTLCQVAADLCLDSQLEQTVPQPLIEGLDDSASTWTSANARQRLKGKTRESLKNLGMITLNDMDDLKKESESGTGWIACTTDAIFLERPEHYDLLIDLTTSTPHKASRPTFHLSTPLPTKKPPTTRGPTHSLSVVRSTWSDLKLWTELDRLLRLDATSHPHSHSGPHVCCSPTSSSPHQKRGPGGVGPAPPSSSALAGWTDVWKIYEDVCVICAGLWFGAWRRNSIMSYSSLGGAEWGAARSEGDEDLTYEGDFMRNVGQGIEGRPISQTVSSPALAQSCSMPSSSGVKSNKYGMGVEGGRRSSSASLGPQPIMSMSPTGAIGNNRTSSSKRRTSGMSTWSSATKVAKEPSGSTSGGIKRVAEGGVVEEDEEDAGQEEVAKQALARQIDTTRALLQTFDAHTRFTLDTLANLLDRDAGDGSTAPTGTVREIVLTPKDISAFELGPMSSLDARFVEWLIDEYGGGAGVSVKRGWKELFGLILGLGS